MNKFTREFSNKENCISSSSGPAAISNFARKKLNFFNKISNYDVIEMIDERPKDEMHQMEELILDDDNDNTALEINESDSSRLYNHQQRNYNDENEAINLEVCHQKAAENSQMEEVELVHMEGAANAVIGLKNDKAYLINSLINNDEDPLNLSGDEYKEKKNSSESNDSQVLHIHCSPITLDSDDDDHSGLQAHWPSENCSMQQRLDKLSLQISKDITITAINNNKPGKMPTAKLKSYQIRKSLRPTENTINETNSPSPISSTVVTTIDLIDSSEEETTTSVKPAPIIRKSKLKGKRCLLTNEMSQKQVLDYATVPNNIRDAGTPIKIEPSRGVILPPPTAQSDFLSAVNLQPIPIGFDPYLEHSTFHPRKPACADVTPVALPTRWHQLYTINWLEYFIKQFANPQLMATHACFRFLQRALKYKEFARIKAERLELDVKFQENQSFSNSYVDNNLKCSLQQIFFKNSKELSKQGKRFCELICRRTLKPIALLTNVSTGNVAVKTLYINPRFCNDELSNSDKRNALNENLHPTNANNTFINAGVAPPWPSTVPRKRHCNDEDEYMPSKSSGLLHNAIANGVAERKQSLRTKRTRRLDSNFSYNEELSDDMDADAEADAESAIAASRADIQRRVDEKRLEAQLQRMRQVKSFENEFIQILGKHIKLETTENSNKTNSSYTQRIPHLSMENYSNKLESQLLRNTWLAYTRTASSQITNSLQDEHDDNEMNDDDSWLFNLQRRSASASYEKFSVKCNNNSPNHLEYQTNCTKLNGRYQLVKSRGRRKRICSILPTGDRSTIDDRMRIVDDTVASIDCNTTRTQWPKNIDINMHINGSSKGVCVICKLNAQRMVQHYVNEHRGCEIYISRLTIEQIDALKYGQANLASISIYKNGQNQYKANCIFCEKPSRFMLPYWYQHFTMHTGEYAYRCTVCGVRKPTRSLLSQYHAQPYACSGDIIQDYVFDSKAKQIEACLCTLCNYVQLQRRNIIIHLQQQHNIQHIQSEHIDTIILLKTKATLPPMTSNEEVVTTQEKLPETENDLRQEANESNESNHVDDTLKHNLIKDINSENYTHNILANEKKGFLDYIPPPAHAATATVAKI